MSECRHSPLTFNIHTLGTWPKVSQKEIYFFSIFSPHFFPRIWVLPWNIKHFLLHSYPIRHGNIGISATSFDRTTLTHPPKTTEREIGDFLFFAQTQKLQFIFNLEVFTIRFYLIFFRKWHWWFSRRVLTSWVSNSIIHAMHTATSFPRRAK